MELIEATREDATVKFDYAELEVLYSLLTKVLDPRQLSLPYGELRDLEVYQIFLHKAFSRVESEG